MILRNPAHIALSDISYQKTSVLKEAIELCPYQNSYLQVTLEAHLKRFKTLRKLNLKISKEEPSNVVIIGAGPAGLLRAIIASLEGFTVTVIEKRSKEDKTRPNVLVLGRNGQKKDLEILASLGILEKLKIEKQLGEFYTGITVRIADLEDALKYVLAEILGGDCIVYNHAVVAIREDENNKYLLEANCVKEKKLLQVASLTIEKIEKTEKKFDQSFKADILVIADGAHSDTSHLLGIERIPLAEQSRILIADFSHGDPGLGAKTIHFVKGVFSGISKHGAIFEKDPAEQFKKLNRQLLFRVPTQDYLIKGLTSDEEKDPFYVKVETLQHLQHKVKKPKHAENKEFLDRIEELKNVEPELEKRTLEGRSVYDVIDPIFLKKGFESKLHYDKSTLLPVRMHRAECSSQNWNSTRTGSWRCHARCRSSLWRGCQKFYRKPFFIYTFFNQF